MAAQHQARGSDLELTNGDVVDVYGDGDARGAEVPDGRDAEKMHGRGGDDDDDDEEAEAAAQAALFAGWKTRALRIGMVGALVNCQPSEPYLSKYLLEDKGLTEDEVNLYVWPTNTISTLVFLIPAGLLAERIGYWRVILLGLLFRVATRCLLIWGEGLDPMVAMQVTYSGAIACTSVLYASVLLVVPKVRAAHASALVYSMYHFGNVIGSLMGEGIERATGNLRLLFFISFGFTLSGLVFFLVLFPKLPARKALGLLFDTSKISFKHASSSVKNEVANFLAFGNPVKLWTAAAMFSFASTFMWGNYYQVLFYDIDPDTSFGFLEMGLELCNAIGSLTPLIIAYHRDATALERYSAPLAILACVVIGSMETASAEINVVGPLYAFAIIRSLASASLEVALQTVVGTDKNTKRYALFLTSIQMFGLTSAVIVQRIGKALVFDALKFVLCGAFLNAIGAFAVLCTWAYLHFSHNTVVDEGFESMQTRAEPEL
ncbi:Folate transporter 1 [Hondaea fermentalgiana]|uniref:Folate transporter 1 n=1 Tax=Hondaea fermentalgiana TaxID=2315210 RepID=A0A2R5GQR7_9STRA|nr:Folate transporter 1 [Hondaea fermentalgiana]|eukprot:GBG33226.1 Folate transporter 1 [Hondaea fermentalgiana]